MRTITFQRKGLRLGAAKTFQSQSYNVDNCLIEMKSSQLQTLFVGKFSA